MMMSRIRLFLSLWVCLSLAALVLSFSCTKHRSANPLAPVGDPTVFITSLTANPPLVKAGADSALITAQVVDSEGQSLSDRVVEFTTSLGSVDAQSVTDASGQASAVYRSGSEDGLARVTASVGDVYRTVEVQVGLGSGMITAQPASLLADGVSTSQVTARIRDQNGMPQPGATVYFYSTCGQISPSATTDSEGRAVATLTAPVSVRDTVAYISVSTAQARGLPSEPSVPQKANGRDVAQGSAAAKGLAPASAAELGQVAFRGISLSLTSEDQALSADGLSSTQLVAGMTETSPPHAPVAGLTVTFVTNLGSVSPREATTNADGRAVATLTSGREPGTANVRVEYRSIIVCCIDVTLRSLTLTLAAEELSLLADGQSTMGVTALLLNSDGNPVAGATVEFSADRGSISSPRVTGLDGRATATLTSSTTPGTCHIVARYGQSVTASLAVEFSSYDLALLANPPSLLADGADSSLITLVLRDGEGLPLANETVELSTDLGEVYPWSVVTDAGGSGRAFLVSWASPVDTQAVVTATFKESSGRVTVPQRGIRFELAADPSAIVANGTSQTQISASLQEATSGLPLASRKVTFQTNLGEITEEVLTNGWGQATAILVSEMAAGTATVTARYGSVIEQITLVEFLPTDISQVALVAEQGQRLADGQSQTLLTATVTDADGEPIENVAVSFWCDAGTVTATAVTDGLGRAQATYTSPVGQYDQTVGLFAGVGPVTGQTQIDLLGVTFSVQTLQDEVFADGISGTTVIAEIKETTSGLPLVGRTVNFQIFHDLDGDGVQDGGEISLGQIGSSGLTDASGQARVSLVSSASTADLEATVRAETAAGLMDTATLSFVGLVLEMSADPPSVVANGVSTTTITAVLRENNRGYGVPGREVEFTTNLGQFSEGRGTTDGSGQIEVILISSTSPGASMVEATYGNTISGTVTVQFTAVEAAEVLLVPQASEIRADGVAQTEIAVTVVDADGNPIQDCGVIFETTIGSIQSPVHTDAQGQAQTILSSVPSGADMVALVTATAGSVSQTVQVTFMGVSLILSAQTPSLLADGVDSTIVTVLYKEVTSGIPIVGETIQFVSFEDLDEDGILEGGETLLGAVTPEAITDIDGQAQVTFVSSADSIYRLATVRAMAGAGIMHGTTVEVFGVRLLLEAEDSAILANGISSTEIVATLTAQGEDVASGPINARDISFKTNLGTLFPESGTTGADGQVHTALTSTAYPGMAIVTATATGASANTEVSFISGQASNIVFISVTYDSIKVRASGGNETSIITFEVRDATGTPLDLSQQVAVDFEILGPSGGGEFLEPISDLTDGHGRVYTTLNSGTVAKTLKVRATIESLGIVSEAIRIVIYGGPPDSNHFSVVFDTVGIDYSEGWKIYGLEKSINAFVGDQYGNPVLEGTSVYFSTTGGIIEGMGITDSIGQVRGINLITADPWPVFTALDPSSGYTTDVSAYCDFTYPNDGNGQTIVFAQTMDFLGNPIWAHAKLVFSDYTGFFNVSPNTFDISNGGSQAFALSIHDAVNGIPLAAGTHIAVSATSGQLTGDIDTTLTETQLTEWIDLSFTLSDNVIGDSSPPKACKLTIEVTSAVNGDARTEIIGTID